MGIGINEDSINIDKGLPMLNDAMFFSRKASGYLKPETGLTIHPAEAASSAHRPGGSGGFTLIELIVVLSLITLVLFFSIPRFENTVLSNRTKKTARWIVGTVKTLRESALRAQKRFILHVDMDTNRLWVSDETMTEEMLHTAITESYTLPNGVVLLDVEFPLKGKISSGQSDISFYKFGYSDKAIIHIEDENHYRISFLLEPFLPNTKLYQQYVSFEG